MCRLVCRQHDFVLIMYHEIIYKALAREPLYFGIPLIPLLLAGAGGFVVALIVYLPLIVVLVLVLFVMKKLTDKDEQLFRQLFLHWRLDWKTYPNKFYWKRVYSFAPVIKKPELIIGSVDRDFLRGRGKRSDRQA